MSLNGQSVVVTGGGSGIGAAIAQSLAAAGCRVAIGGRRKEPLEQVAAAVEAEHPVRAHTLDVADDASIDRFFAWAAGELGPIDILVNSAGTNIANRTFAEMRPEQWDEVMRINATGAYRCMHQVLSSMRERRSGIVVNISSIAGKRASALGGVVYCASKFAMSALSIATANEVKADGVRVTNVYPGEVNTPILDRRPVPVSDAHRESILQPEDVAAVVLTICQLPPRAHVPEVVVKPTHQEWL
ncbi:SDR family oxidoreductase [Candidatus Laterigemmans baculatus]|uniref:SDR family oxidoreductase n=1 Tax=Candidatus Laterigemmans baculatus TaxID=2770505 RepID=UPI0013DC06D3|nr:SDR family NAD(P)-dependent oxidoreductase [Candidatus Laterigemmans baculatus]